MTVTSSMLNSVVVCFFFFNDTATTEIYTLSLHDALPILRMTCASSRLSPPARLRPRCEADEQTHARSDPRGNRSEEHTSELQSRQYLVCRLLLEKKNSHQHLHRSGAVSAFIL